METLVIVMATLSLMLSAYLVVGAFKMRKRSKQLVKDTETVSQADTFLIDLFAEKVNRQRAGLVFFSVLLAVFGILLLESLLNGRMTYVTIEDVVIPGAFFCALGGIVSLMMPAGGFNREVERLYAKTTGVTCPPTRETIT